MLIVCPCQICSSIIRSYLTKVYNTRNIPIYIHKGHIPVDSYNQLHSPVNSSIRTKPNKHLASDTIRTESRISNPGVINFSVVRSQVVHSSVQVPAW